MRAPSGAMHPVGDVQRISMHASILIILILTLAGAILAKPPHDQNQWRQRSPDFMRNLQDQLDRTEDSIQSQLVHANEILIGQNGYVESHLTESGHNFGGRFPEHNTQFFRDNPPPPEVPEDSRVEERSEETSDVDSGFEKRYDNTKPEDVEDVNTRPEERWRPTQAEDIPLRGRIDFDHPRRIEKEVEERWESSRARSWNPMIPEGFDSSRREDFGTRVQIFDPNRGQFPQHGYPQIYANPYGQSMFPAPFMEAPWEWWKGPNVCVSKEEKEEEGGGESYFPSLQFTNCHDTGRRYDCVTRFLAYGMKRIFRVTFRCCEGFSRPRNGFCERSANLQSVSNTIEALDGKLFMSLADSCGIKDVFEQNGITVFLPIPSAIEELAAKSTRGRSASILEFREATVNGRNDGRRKRRRREKGEKRSRRRHRTVAQSDIGSSEVSSGESNFKNGKKKRKNDAIQNGSDIKSTLTSHVAISALEMADFVDEKVLYSPLNSTIRINVYEDHPEGTVMTANCAKMVAARDFPASNGVIHRVERSMYPVTDTLADLIRKNPDLSDLAALIQGNVMGHHLEDESQHFTLLAPSNQAFRKTDPVVLAGMKAGEACLNTILSYLMMPRSVCSSAVHGAVLAPTLLGEPMRLERRDTKMFAGEDSAQITRKDLVGTNGVMHIIDDLIVPPRAQKMSDVLKEGGLTSFLELLEEAQLRQHVDTMANVTVFAPSNEAVARMGQQALSKLKADPAALEEWLLYHITQPMTRACDMATSRVMRSGVENKGVRLQLHPQTFYHSPMPINPASMRATAQCALIKYYDGIACGGVVHVIDRTLSAPKAKVVEMAQSDAQLSLFNQILQTSELTEELSTDGPWTILAPTDDAFQNMPPRMQDELRQDSEKAKDFIKRHVLKDALCCSAVPAYGFWGQWAHPSLSSSTISFHRDHLDHVYANAAPISTCDLTATNGILHKIDKVIEDEPSSERYQFPIRNYGGYPYVSY